MNDILIAKFINFLKRIWGNFCETSDRHDGGNVFLLLIILALFIWSFFWYYSLITIIAHFTIFLFLIITLYVNFSE